MQTCPENNTVFFDSAKFNEADSLNLAESLHRRWQKLCERFLPVSVDRTIWRYSRIHEPEDPNQGWKIHVSATVLNAAQILESIAPFLISEKVLFKAPISLPEIKKINSGIYYKYSQIGKIFTVYPQNDEQAVFFAERLHQLTGQFSAPVVPFDFRFKPESCVFYRYGAFKTFELRNEDGSTILAMRDACGKLIPDGRFTDAHPEWISNPFPAVTELQNASLPENYKVFRALSQRGKGGVYQAFDLNGDAPRFCLVKEGRKNGEIDWDGRDGFWRVQAEKRALEILRRAGVEVPEIYFSFETGNSFYLVTEFIEGETLHRFLQKRKRRLSISQSIKYAIKLANIITQIHSAGWLWRDCKPDNLIIAESGDLRPIDFEGAYLIEQPDYIPCSTLTAELLEESENFSGANRINPDLFSLGAIIYLLFEGELPQVTIKRGAPRISRRNVPGEIKLLVSLLLDPKAAKYPTAKTVAQKLEAILKSV